MKQHRSSGNVITASVEMTVIFHDIVIKLINNF